MPAAALLSLLLVLPPQSPLSAPADTTSRPMAVRLVFGMACEPGDTVVADAFELELAEDARVAASGVLRLTRTPDVRSDGLQPGRSLPRHARLEVDSAGTRLLAASLDGVAVRSYRLAAAAPDPGQRAQILGLEEALAQLRADHREATRALETIEALDQQRVTARLELPRARERVATLALRVRMQEERLAAVEGAAARRRALEERVVLGFNRLTLQPAPPDGRCADASATRRTPRR